MEFRILGSLEVVEDGHVVPLGRGRERALLAVLLLHRNEVVTVDRLIDDLWGDEHPETAANVVQVYVSRVRKALGAGHADGVLETTGSGYALRVEDDALDADGFERLSARGCEALARSDPAEASALFGKALALWSGPPLADFTFDAFAEAEISRLEELRLAALEGRIEAELGCGNHSTVIGELELLVREHPLRERFRGQLMLALYRSGRQAEALRVYRETRETLVEELGLEPGNELQELEKAILAHDATIEAPTLSGRAGASADRDVAARRAHGRFAVALVTVLLLAAALGLAFAFHGRHPALKLLRPNSVGFIDTGSGRVKKVFGVDVEEPTSLTVADGSLWVGSYRHSLVVRVDRVGGKNLPIPIGGRPSGLTHCAGKVWVWTLEGRLVPIDPQYDSPGSPIDLGKRIPHFAAPLSGVAPASTRPGVAHGKITCGGGYLWITVPPLSVIRVDPAHPRSAYAISPNDGVGGPIAYHEGETWVAGYDKVFPIVGRTALPGTPVGLTRDLAFGLGKLWVITGSHMELGPAELRGLDPRGLRLSDTTIGLSKAPVAVAAMGGSIWVASREDRTIRRIEPVGDGERVVTKIPLGARPNALAVVWGGIWVVVE